MTSSSHQRHLRCPPFAKSRGGNGGGGGRRASRASSQGSHGLADSVSSQKLLPSNGDTPSNRDSWQQELGDVELDELARRQASNRPTCQILNQDTEDELYIQGYALVFWREVLLWIAIFATGGLLWLIFYWLPRYRLVLSSKRVPLAKAETILIRDDYSDYSRYYVKPVLRNSVSEAETGLVIPAKGEYGSPGEFQRLPSYRYFRCQKMTYIWDDSTQEFFKLCGLDSDQVRTSFFQAQQGLTSAEQKDRRHLFGPNMILVPRHSIPYLLVKEILNPFYVFQVFSVILWYCDEYMYYATAIVIMSAAGITASIYQTRVEVTKACREKIPNVPSTYAACSCLLLNEANLLSTIQHSDTIKVVRKGDQDEVIESVSTDDLVPGDVIEIPEHGCDLLCDAVVISGTAIVNEAMLTGESVPVSKTAITPNDHEGYNEKEHARNTLFCGTTVIQTRAYQGQRVLAVVIRTGFLTSKGNLVRSIMYPPPVDFKFEQDSYKFIGFLASVAIVGFTYTVVTEIQEGSTASEIALDALDLITIVVPPALPAAMTIGSIYAQKRLKTRGIFCISPRTINVSGSIDCVCFDKTGTLTEDGLDLNVVVPLKGEKVDDPAFAEETHPVDMEETSGLLRGMASCHSLMKIDDELTGDPLDDIMFSSTAWEFVEPVNRTDNISIPVVHPATASLDSPLAVGIVREFPFASARQCMSVITRKIGDAPSDCMVYCKGSPEKILSLARPETIPRDFHSVLERYTSKGARVIAMSRRSMNIKPHKLQRLERDDVEKSLDFLGFIVFANRLKSETTPVIQELQRANLRTIMVTGDNLNTAVSVAYNCGMLDKSKKTIQVKAASWSISASTADSSAEASEETGLKYVELESGEDQSFNLRTSALGTKIAIENEYQFVLDGSTFGVIRSRYRSLLSKICTRAVVFARMSPEFKQILVEELQDIGYYIGMCGDGANDCGALKAAHAGISLSEAEASVASPFTSQKPDIECVPHLIKEGRSALVTSFGIFKYMAAYSLTQFTSVLILYSIDSNLTDLQFLYIDLFLITVFAIFFGLTKAYTGPLAPHPPMKSLISVTPLLSLGLQMIVIILFQGFSLYYTRQMDWFVPFDSENPTYNGTEWADYYNSTTITESEVACFENYAIFAISSFQYIILAYVFSKSIPYRRYIYTNYLLVFSMLFMTGFTIYLVMDPNTYFQRSMELLLPPEMDFRWIMLGFAAVNIVICVLIEDVFMEFVFFRWLRKICHRTESSKRRYLAIERGMSQDLSWPRTIASNGADNTGSEDNQHAPEALPAVIVETEELKTDANCPPSQQITSAHARSHSNPSSPLHLPSQVGPGADVSTTLEHCPPAAPQSGSEAPPR